MTEEKRADAWRRSSPLTDPKAMRALAHPARLEILTRLQGDGPATATEVAEQAGVTPSAASYHLRMLAKYGFVEDAPARGDGRERLWRATASGFSVDSRRMDDSPEVRAAKELLITTVYDDALKELKRAMALVDREPEEWHDGSAWQRTQILVDAAEMKSLSEQLEALIRPYRAQTRTDAPEGARVAVAQFSVYLRPERPAPGLPTEDHGAA